jgi:DNA-binding protein HU-beta
MTKSELIEQIAKTTGVKKASVAEVFGALVDTATEALRRGDDVSLGELGKLKVKRREARPARNPRTGDTVMVGAKNVVKFTASKDLASSVA